VTSRRGPAAALGALASAGLRRPRAALVTGALAALACLALAVGLAPSAAPALLADPGSGPGAATPPQERTFGAEPIAIVVRGDLSTRTLTPANLSGLLELEGRIAKVDGVRAVFGPGTFVNQTIVQIEKVLQSELGPVAERADRVARTVRRRVLAGGGSEEVATRRAESARLAALGPKRDELANLLVRFGSIGFPSLSNRNYVLNLVFGAAQEPKLRFRWLFPDRGHAVVLVRPRAGLSDARLRDVGDRLQALARDADVTGLRLTVAGAPLVVAGIADEFPAELLRLAPIVLLAMVLALLLGLRGGRGRLRLLVLAAGAVLATAAASRLLGLGLTPATVAALPVVLGLAVDYGVQLQARYWGERRAAFDPPLAARRALVAVGPTLLAAAGAMAVGFLALTLSPVPLIDRLGVTLAAGTLASVAVVLAFGAPLLAARDRGGSAPPELPARRLAPLGRTGRLALAGACVVAAAGLAVAGSTQVQSDLTQLAPRGLPELRAATDVQRELGTGGTLRLAVTGADVASPAAVAWQARLQRRALALDGRLRPGPNLGALLTSGGQAPRTRAEIDEVLALVPRYLLDAVLTRDRRRGELSFGVPLVDVHEQARLLDRILAAAGPPPEGVSVQAAGLVALGVASVRDLEDDRPVLLLLGALLVFAVLLALYRRVDRALLPLVPALLAAGIAALLVRLSGVELSPLGAGLEPLVLAVGVEFGVLLEARYREARREGASPEGARRAAVGRVGAAVAVSAATVGLGFATLAASRFELLQQFGVLVALEVALCAALAVWLVPLLAEALEHRAAARAAARGAGARARLPVARPRRVRP
jgi:predicted RND superfamily exporter protein